MLTLFTLIDTTITYDSRGVPSTYISPSASSI
jgi:hypothetical protein